jgi:acyl-CoA thioester hydrolase
MAAYHFSHRVTYADCTLGDHVYYARYLDFLEAARNELFRSLGAPMRELQEQDVIFPVVECRLQYKAPARYDDLITVELWLSGVERVRLNFSSRILNQAGNLLVEAETVHACTHCNNQPRRIPETLRSVLLPYTQANPVAAR